MLLVFALGLSKTSFAQVVVGVEAAKFDCEIKNITQVSPTEFQLDVWIKKYNITTMASLIPSWYRS
jgi:hypothetical protein